MLPPHSAGHVGADFTEDSVEDTDAAVDEDEDEDEEEMLVEEDQVQNSVSCVTFIIWRNGAYMPVVELI